MHDETHGGTDGILRDIRAIQALENIKNGIRYVSAHEITENERTANETRKYALGLNLRPYPAVRAMLAELKKKESSRAMDAETLMKSVMADDAVLTEIAVSWPDLLKRAQSASGAAADVAELEIELDGSQITNFAAVRAFLETRLLENGLFPWPKLDEAQVAAVFLAAALELRD